MSGDREEPQVGTVAEEAAKLLGALSGWAKDAAYDVDAHIATGAPECTACPICRTVHAVRELSPEVTSHLASAATSLMHAAAGLMATATPGPGAREGVEHIDLDDDGDWPADPEDPEEDNR